MTLLVPAISPKPRDIRRLGSDRFDALVIGGGITGAGIARDLALRGATVALVEQDDFANGTSSRSTKLIHGGLRYLESLNLSLVFEACRERRILQQIAPHLVRPLPLMIPLYRGARRSRSLVHAGMLLYDLLALGRNTRPHRMLSAEEARRRQPVLDPRGLTGAALYWDCRMDDARLCLENVIAAREAGAVTVNYARVTALPQRNGRITGAVVEDRETGETHEVAARIVVNASGPWLDRVGALAGDWTPRLRPTRGSHLLVPRLTAGGEALYLSADRDDRMFFIIPWGEQSLIGTTDLDDGGPPEAAAITDREVDYLLEETARHLPGTRLSGNDIVSTFAGIRPLLAGRPGQASAVSREHALFETAGWPDRHRRRQVHHLPGHGRRSGRSGHGPPRATARGGADRSSAAPRRRPRLGGCVWPTHARAGIDAATLRRLVDRYGSRTGHLLELLGHEPELAAPVAPDLPLLQVEVAYAADFEMARTPEDVLRRRSPAGPAAGSRPDCRRRGRRPARPAPVPASGAPGRHRRQLSPDLHPLKPCQGDPHETELCALPTR